MITALSMGAMLRHVRALPWCGGLAVGVAACVAIASADPAMARRRSVEPLETKKENKAPRREGPVFAIVSIGDQRVSFYGAEGLVARSAVSTGKPGHRTPTGVFSILQKKVFHRSNLYSDAPMPHMQRLTWSGIAMHAGALPGYPASHGCIRLPASFASKAYSLTKMGQRVVVSPRDLVPVDVEHHNLPAPMSQPAPGEPAPMVTAHNAAHATVSDANPVVTGTGTSTDTGANGQVEEAGFKEPSAQPKLLNPLEYAWALRAEAQARAKALAQAVKAARTAESPKEDEARTAARALKAAEGSLASLQSQITAIQRRIDRTTAELENAKKGTEAKDALDSRIAEAQKAIDEAQQARAAKEAELKDAWQTASKLETEGKTAEAKAADDRAGDLEDQLSNAGKAVKSAQRTLERLQDQVAGTLRKQTRAQEEFARVEAALAKLNEEKAGLEAKLPDTQRMVEEAKQVKAEKDKEHADAKKSVEDAENALEENAALIKEASRRLEPVSVFISRKTGRLYVRQGFRSVFDVAVEIKDREQPIGTHVFVSTEALEDGARLRWAAVSVPDDEEKKAPPRKKRKSSSIDDDPETTAAIVLPPETPKSALDRIEIPAEAKERLAKLAWVGAMLTISDRGMSGETNESTDFVILTHSRR